MMMMQYIRKRKILTVSLILFFILALITIGYLFYRKQIAPKTMREMMERIYPVVTVRDQSDREMPSYDQLTQRAYAIAIVTPFDDLTKENSFGLSQSWTSYPAAHSTRRVQAIQYFKNTKALESTLSITEKCGITDIELYFSAPDTLSKRGGLVVLNGCYPMQKGNTYLVFFTKTSYGYPVSETMLDLTWFRLNQRLDVGLNALYHLNLFSGTATEKEILGHFLAAVSLPVSEESSASYLALDGWESISIDTEYTDPFMEATLWYLKTETGYLFRLGELLYEYEK